MVKTLLLKSEHYLIDYLKLELKDLGISKFDVIESNILVYCKNDFDEVFTKLFYFCKSIERLYLEISADEPFDFNLVVDLKERYFVDLVGFSLFDIDYLDSSGLKVPFPIIVKLVSLLGIKDKQVSAIDPHSGYGTFIISIYSILTKFPIHAKKRLETVYSQKFTPLSFPRNKDAIKLKFTGIVQDDISFKRFKQNLAFFGLKIKLSKFDFDWLDVKFKDSDFDYTLSVIDYDDNEKIKHFFYQTSFITKKNVCLISKSELKKSLYTKYLNLKQYEKISDHNNEFHIYIFEIK